MDRTSADRHQAHVGSSQSGASVGKVPVQVLVMIALVVAPAALVLATLWGYDEVDRKLDQLATADNLSRSQAIHWVHLHLDQLDPARIRPGIVMSLADPSSNVRSWSVEILSRMDTHQPEADLDQILALIDDPSASVRYSVMVAVERLLDKVSVQSECAELVPQLILAIDDVSMPVRLAAALLLARLGHGERTYPFLRYCMERNYQDQVFVQATYIFERYPDAYAQGEFDLILLEIVNDQETAWVTRYAAARAIGQMGYRSRMLAFLEEMQRNASSRELRIMAREALDEFAENSTPG